MTDELKPVQCGCGGEAEVRPHIANNTTRTFFVICPKCGMRSWRFRERAEAITAWNRAMSGSTEEKLKAFWDGMSAEMKEERKTGDRTAKVRDKKDDPMVDEWYHGRCMNCGKQVRRRDNYCSRCGCRLIWGED